MMAPDSAASTVPTATPKSMLSSGTPAAAAPINASTPRKDDKRSVDSQSHQRVDLSGVRSGQPVGQLGRSSPNVLPRNPRDTAVPFSPKRRVKNNPGLSGAVSLGGSTGNVHGSVGSAHHRSHLDVFDFDANSSNNAHAAALPPSGRPTTPSNNALLHPHATIPLVHSLVS